MNNLARNCFRPLAPLALALLLTLPALGQETAPEKEAPASLELVLGGSLALFLFL